MVVLAVSWYRKDYESQVTRKCRRVLVVFDVMRDLELCGEEREVGFGCLI